MKVIPETRRAHEHLYLRFSYNSFVLMNYSLCPSQVRTNTIGSADLFFSFVFYSLR